MKTEFKGTPGPWLIGDFEYNKYGVQTFSIDANGVETLAEVYEDEEMDLESYMANTRLIACAPELLNALEILLFAYESDGTEDFHNINPAQVAKNAIKKALNLA